MEERSQPTWAVRSLDPRFCRYDYIPSDTEKSHLVETLREETKNLQRCKRDLFRTSSVEEEKQLKRQKQALKDIVRTCRSALSVQRQLPIELWDQIFSALCLVLHEYSFDHDTPTDEEPLAIKMPALLLSQVCSHWRRIAKGSPHIWTTISFRFSNGPLDIRIPLELYLTNAKGHLLSIRIVKETDCPLSDAERGAWQILSQHVPYCKDLALEGDYLDEIPAIPALSFPNLESLSFESDSRLSFLWLWEPIHEAPKLTKVVTSEFQGMLPFCQLTSLHLLSTDPAELALLLHALPACEQLAEIILWSPISGDTDSALIAGVVEAPRSLRKLAVLNQPRTPLARNDPVLLTVLTTLSLSCPSSLVLRCEDWPPLAPLLTMALERAPLLEAVTFMMLSPAETDMSSHPLIPFLRSVRHLTHFELYMGPPRTKSARRFKYLGSGQIPLLRIYEPPLDKEEEVFITQSTSVLSDLPENPFSGRPRIYKRLKRGRKNPFSNELLSTVLSNLKLGADPERSPVLVPKLESMTLRLSGVTLDSDTVEQVLAAVSERHLVSRALKEFRLVLNWDVDQTAYVNVEDKLYELPPPFVERIREIRRDLGIKVVIEESGRPWEGLFGYTY